MSGFGGEEILKRYITTVDARIEGLEAGMATAQNVTNRAMANMRGAANSTSAAMGAMGRRVASSLAAAAARAAAFGASFLVATKAATDLADRAERRLARALRIAGDESGETERKIASLADRLSSVTTMSRNRIRELAATGAQIGGMTGEQLESATAAAIGLAAQYENLGLTADQAMRMIARSRNTGDFSAFERFGIILDDVGTAQERMNRIIAQGHRGLRDSRDAAGTTAGQLQRLANAGSQVLVTFGRLLGLSTEGRSGLEGAIRLTQQFEQRLASLQQRADAVRGRLRRIFDVGTPDAPIFDLTNLQLLVEDAADFMDTRLRQTWELMKLGAAEAFNFLSSNLPTDWMENLLTLWSRTVTEIQSIWDRATTAMGQFLIENVIGNLTRIITAIGTALGIDEETISGALGLARALAAHQTMTFGARDSERRREADERLQERIRSLRQALPGGQIPLIPFHRRLIELEEEMQERFAERDRRRVRRSAGEDEVLDEFGGLGGVSLRDRGVGAGVDMIQTVIGQMRVGPSLIHRQVRLLEDIRKNTEPRDDGSAKHVSEVD